MQNYELKVTLIWSVNIYARLVYYLDGPKKKGKQYTFTAKRRMLEETKYKIFFYLTKYSYLFLLFLRLLITLSTLYILLLILYKVFIIKIFKYLIDFFYI